MSTQGVLAVMDADIRAMAYRIEIEPIHQDEHQKLTQVLRLKKEARATVAELIDAATLILSFNPAHFDTDEEKRLRAALARADGEK